LGDAFEIFAQHAGDAEEDFGSLAGSEIAPAGLPRSMRRFDSGVDIRVIGRRYFRKGFLGGRIDEPGFSAGRGVGVSPVKE
jgi:hypothetical protein